MRRCIYGLPLSDEDDEFGAWWSEFLVQEKLREDCFQRAVRDGLDTLESPFPINARAQMWKLLVVGLEDAGLLYRAIQGTATMLDEEEARQIENDIARTFGITDENQKAKVLFLFVFALFVCFFFYCVFLRFAMF